MGRGFVINRNYNSILYQCMRNKADTHIKGIRKKEVKHHEDNCKSGKWHYREHQ